MPERDVGENWSGVWRVMILGILLLVYVALRPVWIPVPVPVPTIMALPTNTAVLPTAALVLPSQPLQIVVLNEEGKPFEPYTDVVVRVSDAGKVDSGENGQLLVPPCTPGQMIRAWAPGHEVTSVPCNGGNEYRLTLHPLVAYDNPYYKWSPAATDCNMCHGNQVEQNIQAGASFNEVNEWLRSGHAKVFSGGYFESMYKGTTVSGKMSSPANPVIIGNEWVPVPPEQGQDYHGPGFMLDFPQQPGNCAFCHVPAAVLASEAGIHLGGFFPRPADVSGEGVTCDVCHKVFDVTLDDNGFPFTNSPGILSYQFLRPQNGFFMVGPFSNTLTVKNGSTANHRLTCSPVFSRSEFCAPCHFGKFGDMVIYNSYGEWKASPYAANPADPGYRTCQDCHMSHMNAEDRSSVWSERQACSADNTRFQNFDHSMMDIGRHDLPQSGIDIPRMVEDAAAIGIDFGSQPTGTNSLDVMVSVTNTQAGHKFPTDSPLRHLILVVEAVDRVGTPLIQVKGDRVPNWAGPGPASPTGHIETLRTMGIEDYGGRPGRAFANLLVEEETNLSPATAYWNETKYAVVDPASGATSDTRLRPHQADISYYSFLMPDEGDVTVNVKLIYRFAFYDLLVQKEWFDRPDITVAAWQCQGSPRQPQELRQACVKIQP